MRDVRAPAVPQSSHPRVGLTHAACACSYGPREGGRGEAFSELGRLRVDAKLTSFARKHCRGAFGLGAEERHLAAAVTQALQPAVVLESFPKSVVDVYILLLDAHGSELQAAVMAASLALAHAGVHCRDLVTACGVALLRGSQAGCEASGALILDPTDDEIADATAAAVVTAMPCCDCVTHLGLQGGWAGDGGEEALEIGLEGCKSLDEGLRRALREETERGEARARHTAAAAVAAA
jgi:ribonuclease PH